MQVTSGRQLQALARDRRTALGLNQETVARRAGVSRKWVSEFERGKDSVDLALVLQLLTALGLSMQVNPADDQPRVPIVDPGEQPATRQAEAERTTLR